MTDQHTLTAMSEAGVEDLLDYLFDDAAGLSWRIAAEDELRRRGIEARNNYDGKLKGLFLLRRELGFEDSP